MTMRGLPVLLIAIFGGLTGFGAGFLLHLNRLADYHLRVDGKIPVQLKKHRILVLIVEIIWIALFAIGVIQYGNSTNAAWAI